MFKHALTQDVAYASLLVQRRKELHGSIGRAIEELYADRLAEHYEMLAHHFSQAEDWAAGARLPAQGRREGRAGVRPSPGAGALRSRRWRRRAGSAIGCRPPRCWPSTARGPTCSSRVGEFGRSREAARAHAALARRVGDRAAEASALVQLANALQWAEEFPEAIQRARGASRWPRPSGPRAPRRRPVRARLHPAVSGRLDAAGRGPRASAHHRAGGRRCDAPGPGAAHACRGSGAGRDIPGEPGACQRGRAGSRASIGWSFRSSAASGLGAGHVEHGSYDARSRPSPRAWPWPRRSATTRTSPAT